MTPKGFAILRFVLDAVNGRHMRHVMRGIFSIRSPRERGIFTMNLSVSGWFTSISLSRGHFF